MAAQLYYSPFIPAFSPNGLPVPGARLFFFYSGTDNLAPVYTNSSLAVRARNPVVADLAARFDPVYLDDTITYRVRLVDIFGIQLGDDIDPYIPGQALKGPQGEPGLPDNSYSTLMTFKASAINKASATLVGKGRYFWTTGDFTNQDDDSIVIKANSVPLTAGAWVKDGASLPNIITDGRDNTTFLQQIITASDCLIPKKDYLVTKALNVPAGRKIRIDPGTVFKWGGSSPPQGGPWVGVFAVSDNTEIVSEGGEFSVRCVTETPFLSVVLGWAVQNVFIDGAFGLNCTQAYFDDGSRTGYDNVITTRMKAAGDTRSVNTSRNIRIRGGGCDFPNHDPSGALGQPERAGVYMSYTEGWVVQDARYAGCYCGIQYWGGDSGLAPFQDMGRLGPDCERKNTDGRMINCVSYRTGAGFWGSMGQNIKVENCDCYFVGDVGHDHEGSVDVTVKNSHAEDCHNGGFATFSLCKRIRFLNCTGKSTNKAWPLYRSYNLSQTQLNEDIAFIGGSFCCTDTTGPATFDTSFGPARRISITGAKFDNVRIDFNTLNNGQVVVSDNILSFPYIASAAFNAIDVGRIADTGYGKGLAIVQDNVIVFQAVQPNPTAAINLLNTDFNSTTSFRVKGNTIVGKVSGNVNIGIRAIQAGTNGGVTMLAIFDDNQLDGIISVSNTGGGAPGGFFARQNFNSTNADVGITGP